MRAASNTPNKQDAARFRRRCRELIAYAEKLKTQLSNDPTAENGSDILQKASLLHGNEFQPWDKNPSEAEFQREAGQQLFMYAIAAIRRNSANPFVAVTGRPSVYRRSKRKTSQHGRDPRNWLEFRMTVIWKI